MHHGNITPAATAAGAAAPHLCKLCHAALSRPDAVHRAAHVPACSAAGAVADAGAIAVWVGARGTARQAGFGRGEEPAHAAAGGSGEASPRPGRSQEPSPGVRWHSPQDSTSSRTLDRISCALSWLSFSCQTAAAANHEGRSVQATQAPDHPRATAAAEAPAQPPPGTTIQRQALTRVDSSQGTAATAASSGSMRCIFWVAASTSSCRALRAARPSAWRQETGAGWGGVRGRTRGALRRPASCCCR